MFRFGTRIGVDSGRFGALPGAPGRFFWCFKASLETLGMLLGSSLTLPRRRLNALGCHGTSQEGPMIHFESILGAQEPPPGSAIIIDHDHRSSSWTIMVNHHHHHLRPSSTSIVTDHHWLSPSSIIIIDRSTSSSIITGLHHL